MKNINKKFIFTSFIILGLTLIASPVFARASGSPTATTLDATNITQNSATLVAEINPDGNNTNTWFEYGTDQSLGTRVFGPALIMPASIIKNITGLNPGTTYYFRACTANAVDQGGCGETLNFKTIAIVNPILPPTVSTNSATNVSETSARLNGNWSANGAFTSTWFEYSATYSKVANGTGITTNMVAQGLDSGTMNQTITNLNPNTTYYFRAWASNSYGYDEGSILSFATDDDGSQNGSEPDVVTNNAINITEDSATLKATIDSDDGATYWFEYGTSSGNLSKETSHSSVSSGSRSVSKAISNLISEKTYYFRVVAENDNGTSYGSIKNFSTENDSNSNQNIIITTQLSSAVTQTTAQVNGLAIDPVGDSSVSVWFEYGFTPALGYTSPSESLGAISSKYFSTTFTNLAPNTIYYFRAVGKNDNGVTRGDILVLKTTAVYVVPTYPSVNPPVVQPINNPVSSSAASKFISLKIENKFENVSAGDTIEYEITFKNISAKTIKEAILKVELPAQVSFERASKGEFSGSSLILKLDILESGDEEKVVISGSVANGVNKKDVLLATATVFYPNPTTLAKENITAYVVNNVVEKNLLPAASIFGNGGFLPNTLTEWLLLTGSIFALIYFGRKFYADLKAPKAQA